MNHIITDLQQKFRKGDICLKFIYANIGIFLILAFTNILFRLFNLPEASFVRYLEFPAQITSAVKQPWSLLTYMFLHANILHLLFNMLWLYWFGRLFLYSYSARHFQGLYLLGGIVGGILYLLAYNVFPYFHPMLEHSMLLGASASVLAIVIATAINNPEYPLQFLFIGAIRLKYVAIIVVLMDLLLITSNNSGGHIAHIGGALAGWWFAIGIKRGSYDATAWINIAIDSIGKWFNPRAKSAKPRMKVHYGNKRSKDYEYNARQKAQSDEIDRILDKIRQTGYEGLSSEEKKTLFDASKK